MLRKVEEIVKKISAGSQQSANLHATDPSFLLETRTCPSRIYNSPRSPCPQPSCGQLVELSTSAACLFETRGTPADQDEQAPDEKWIYTLAGIRPYGT